MSDVKNQRTHFSDESLVSNSKSSLSNQSDDVCDMKRFDLDVLSTGPSGSTAELSSSDDSDLSSANLSPYFKKESRESEAEACCHESSSFESSGVKKKDVRFSSFRPHKSKRKRNSKKIKSTGPMILSRRVS